MHFTSECEEEKGDYLTNGQKKDETERKANSMETKED